MKKFLKIINCAIILSALLLVNNSTVAVEFKREADKAVWIKNFFKGKKAEPSNYDEEVTKEEIKFEEQLLKDFMTQNGIEHLEPIAVGQSINDPKIAKFNTFCPNKKPIDIAREWQSTGTMKAYEVPECMLEDPEQFEAGNIWQYKCVGNFKIFKFNVFNTKNNRQDYILYCDNFIRIKDTDKSITQEQFYIKGSYLQIFPHQCLYSRRMYLETYAHRKDWLSGIFKYQGNYYFYNIETMGGGVTYIGINIWKEGIFPWSKSYIYKINEESK